MKKIIKGILVFVLCFGIVGCGSSEKGKDKNIDVDVNIGNEDDRENAKFPLTVNEIELINLKINLDDQTLTSQYINNSKVAITRVISYYKLPNGEVVSIAHEHTTLPNETSSVGEEWVDEIDLNSLTLDDLELIKIMVTFEPENDEYYNCFEYDYKLKKYEAYHES